MPTAPEEGRAARRHALASAALVAIGTVVAACAGGDRGDDAGASQVSSPSRSPATSGTGSC